MPEGLVAGIDIGGTTTNIVLLESDGTIVSSSRIQTTDPTATARNAANTMEAARGRGALSRIGIGCAGTIDLSTGTVLESPNLPLWEGSRPAQQMEEIAGIPTAFDNDASCAALGEQWLGAGRGAACLVAITLGTGIGGGIVIDGKPWRGIAGTAGEIGHVPIRANDGPPCRCGSRGCLETLASGTALARRIDENIAEGRPTALAPGATAEAAAHAARAGDDLAREIFCTAGHDLGIGLAVLTNLLSPDRIVATGGLSAAWDLLGPPALEALERHAFARPLEVVEVRVGELGEDAGAIGAARLAAIASQSDQSGR